MTSSGCSPKIKSSMRVRTLDESLHGSRHSRFSTNSRVSVSSNVSFNKVQIREYPVTIGDNPSVSTGPPLSIGWDVQEEYHHDLDDYEDGRGPRRETFQMIVPRKTREDMLKHAGHSRREFASAIRGTIRTKNQRKATVRNLQFAKADEGIEKVARKLKGLFRKKEKIDYQHTWCPDDDLSEFATSPGDEVEDEEAIGDSCGVESDLSDDDDEDDNFPPAAPSLDPSTKDAQTKPVTTIPQSPKLKQCAPIIAEEPSTP
eukprot:CAMPEP_0116022308 /NCGR_PEP_ID=MMETSP0321-20121206/10910_1 /TAXON_ID=163516 /ORGANISM="Leptocylindrus danicus var. danicus, Strain B650" /LENGTH=258 /DNA_ID=CAMNT_0003493355 /DNA_START=96 /DNA_END=872 /DNA_ORIENTATION=-